jgi:hypothetical protein
MKGNPMANLSYVLNSVFLPSIKVLERIRSKAHWSLIILLFVVCFLFTLGGGVFYDIFVLYGDRSLALRDISAIVAYNVPWAVLTPLLLCVLWVVQYLVIRLLRGHGDFLTHGWVDFVCFTPCVIALACLWSLPINTWTTIPYLLLLAGILYMCVLNTWMMSVIHEVKWQTAFASTLLGCMAIPIAFMLIVIFGFIFGFIEFPHPS